MFLLFWLSFFGIGWAIVGYPLFLEVLSKIKKGKNDLDYSYEPTVTVMVVAHNEEKVIKSKLDNIVALDYPKEKIQYIVASDFSNDSTEKIVRDYIVEHSDIRMKLYRALDHKGKTNAQNEAQKAVNSEILVMTDANAMMDSSAVRELVAAFSEENIVYATGRLIYGNAGHNDTANNEDTYWNLDLKMREVESNIKTITAGNGAIYACRNNAYIDIDPIKCHDLWMPVYYGLQGKRCVFNKKAIAYEKAGENDADEFKRKVRMNRNILENIIPSLSILNIFRNGWFTIFYLGHRSFRYLLWLFHIIAIVTNLFLVVKYQKFFYIVLLSLQGIFWINTFVGLKHKPKKRLLTISAYYGMTILAQIKGVFNCVTGRSKAVWDKAESTR